MLTGAWAVPPVVLALVPGRWSQALTFAIFITFILMRPTGLFRIRMQRAS